MDAQFETEMICFYSSYIVLGVSGLFFNTFVLLSIMKMPKIGQNRWLLLSAPLILADTVLSIGFTILSAVTIDQLVRVDAHHMAVAKYSSLSCSALNVFMVSGSISGQFLTISIAIDRVVAICEPLWYRRKGAVMIKSFISVTAVITAGYAIGNFIDVSSTDTIYLCSMSTGQNKVFSTLYYGTNNAMSIAIVVTYFCVLIVTRFRKKKLQLLVTQGGLNSVSVRQLQRQLKITQIISAIVLAYCLTSVPGYTLLDILLLCVPALKTDFVWNIRIAMICQLLISTNTFVNSFLYAWRNTEIRDGTKLLLSGLFKKYPVAPISTVSLGSIVVVATRAVRAESTIQ